MKMQNESFVDAIETGKFDQFNKQITNSSDTAALHEALNALSQSVIESIDSGRLAEATLTIDAPEPVIIQLETNIINLPFQYLQKISQLAPEEGDIMVNVYLIMKSNDLNVSGLHIDYITDTEDFSTEIKPGLMKIESIIIPALQTIHENATTPKEVALEVPENKKKTTAKKTATKRKTAAKKTTTRKTATKKPTTGRKVTKK